MNLPRFEAYRTQVNIDLFNAAVHLALSTTDASKQLPALNRQLENVIWYERVNSQDYFESYGIRYLGELLERYAEKIGDTLPNLRAVALALAWSEPALTEIMFVGSQRKDFMKTVRKSAANDPYLTGALYLMAADAAEKEKQRERLLRRNYKSTEEILFALCALNDCAEAFSLLRPQLVSLLETGRTLFMDGNTGLLAWFLARYRPDILACRKKDNAVLRALLRLTESYVRPGDRAYETLRGAGYLPMDILSANSILVWEQQLGQTHLSSGSIPAERLATAYVTAVLSGDALPSQTILDYVLWLTEHYRRFEIKYEGNPGLWEAVAPQLHIGCPTVMAWMVRSDLKYDYRFDVLDEKWDALAADLPPEKYHELFHHQLIQESEKETLLRMLERYKRLTGSDYASAFESYNYYEKDAFSLLVSQGVLDPWAFFEAHQNDHPSNRNDTPLRYLWDSLFKVSTRSAFEFWHTFFEVYKPADVPRFWPGQKFHDPFIRFYSYTPSLDYLRPELSREENRQLYAWIDESVFTLSPGKYSALVLAFLQSDVTRSLFGMDELRPIFDQLFLLESGNAAVRSLKHQYLTETELADERAAREKTEQERKRAEAERIYQEVGETLTQQYDGRFQSLYEALKSFRSWDHRREYAAQILRGRLPELLKDHAPIETKDFGYLLSLCGRLVGCGALSASAARTAVSTIQITKTEEGHEYADA
jgi:hypothetical protein